MKMLAMRGELLKLLAHKDGGNLVFDLEGRSISLGEWYDVNVELPQHAPKSINAFMDFGNGLLNCSQFVLFKNETKIHKARV